MKQNSEEWEGLRKKKEQLQRMRENTEGGKTLICGSDRGELLYIYPSSKAVRR